MNNVKHWTNEEVEYLQEKWGVISMEGISRKLKRTEMAIRTKAQRLKLGDSRRAGGNISLSAFSKTTGIGNYTINEIWVKNGFKMSKSKRGKFIFKDIDLHFFWKWAEKNKRLVNFAKWEEGALGIEPKWVKEKRNADLMNPSFKNWNRHWTKEEDNLLIQKTKSCRYTYRKLSEEFNRTECAIKRRLLSLGCKYRPVPLENNIKWTEEENKKMLEMYDKGYSTMSIAKILNKTQLSISDRVKKLRGAINGQ